MSDDTFGDFDPEDAYDTEPADPEQVARKMHALRQDLEALAGRELSPWDSVRQVERNRGTAVAISLVGRLTAPDADRALASLAADVHEQRRFVGYKALPWDYLADDERAIGAAITAEVVAWLTRQGAA